MKKLFLIIFSVLIYANSLEYYLFSINMDYREFDQNGAYLDGDSCGFGKLNGIGIKYSATKNISYFLKIEYANGKTHYDGSTWGGTPLSLTKKNVYIWNLEGGIKPINNPMYLSIGYRYWNRGKSDYQGDYDEQYYWPYMGIGYFYVVKLNKIFFTSDLAYQYAINPKINVHLGSGTTLNLGYTSGLKFQLKAFYPYSDNIMLSFMYRYQFWHINRSESGSIILDGSNTQIVEPESFTRNQYLGIGVVYKY